MSSNVKCFVEGVVLLALTLTSQFPRVKITTLEVIIAILNSKTDFFLLMYLLPCCKVKHGLHVTMDIIPHL